MKFNSNPETVISIVTYNGVDALESCLQSLSWTHEDQSVYVSILDNSANKDVQGLCVKYGYLYRAAERNLGFGKGHNQILMDLFSEINHKYTLLLNPDSEIVRSQYYALLKAIKSDEKCAIVAPKLIDENGHTEDSIFTDPSGSAYALDFMKQVFRKSSGPRIGLSSADEDMEVKGASGACLLLDNSKVVNEGEFIFDPDYFMYFEDLDLSTRVRRNGYKILYQNDIKIKHLRGKSSENDPNRDRWIKEMMYKSLMIYFRKNKSVIDQFILKSILIKALYLRIIIRKDVEWSKLLLRDIRAL